MNNPYTLTRPLSDEIQQALMKITNACCQAGCPFFIAGATAREIMLTHVHNRDTGRRTRDIDIAVFIDDWDAFSRLKDIMLEQGAEAANDNAHRLYWGGVELDIIPFGSIATDNQVAWPPDRDIIMSVDGFTDAWEHAALVAIPNCGDIRFCSLPGLLLLKLFAWRDRGDRNSKDAVDIYTIFREYSVIEDSRLYDDDALASSVDWLPERIGARLAGQDVASIVTSQSVAGLQQLDQEKLIDAIVRQSGSARAADIERCINDFWHGLMGA